MTPRPAWPLVLALLWVSVWEPLAPASRRMTWRDQWRGDLWHYWGWVQAHHSPCSAVFSLVVRAWACLPHALALRVFEWSPHMLLHDVKFAWRMTVRRPAFTGVAVLVLGLGIGANATIFSWVETILLQPLPGVTGSSRLVSIHGTTSSRSDLSLSYPNYLDLRAAKPGGIEDIAAFRAVALNMRVGAEPTRTWGELVTPNFFDVLGVRAALGRTFLESDAPAPDREPVVVISANGWRRWFNADPAVVGRQVVLNGRSFTIIGVTPEGFRGSLAGLSLDVFVPITLQKAFMPGDRLVQRGNSWLTVYGRLAPDASVATARESLKVVAARLAAEYPQANEGRGATAVPLWQDGASGMLMPVMGTLMAVVGVVLLIACANLAGLLLARAAGRQREVAVRLAVGASRGRLVRQFLVESALLAGLGGAAGVVLSYWTSGLLAAFVPPTPFPVDFGASVGPVVLVFSIGVTLVTALFCGLLPALRGSRADVAASLKDDGGSVTAGSTRARLRQALVVAQVALSVLLLVCAGLFVRSLGRAQAVDPGYGLRQGIIASIDLLPNGYDAGRGVQFFRQLLSRIETLPQVESATVASAMPLDISTGSDMTVQVDGYQPRDGEELHAYYNRVGPRYFDTLGVPIVRGRAIDATDVEGKPLVVVVNETMASRYWPGGDPIGRTVRFGAGPAVVVGVAKDGKYGRLNESPRNYMYIPEFQYYRPDMQLQVRTAGDPAGVIAAIQSALNQLDPNLPLFDVRTVEEHRQLSVFLPRMAGTLLALFGAVALLLAVVGLYSVIAFNVAQRTREIGIRVALGATKPEILGLVVRQGLWLTGIGLAIGLGLAAAAAQAVKSQLFGLATYDPVSFLGTAGLLVGVAAAACLWPARRAAGLDPLRALRREW